MGYQLPSAPTRFVNENGALTTEAYKFLVGLFQGAGNGSVGLVHEVLHGGNAGFSAIDLANDLTGTLPVVRGGSGADLSLTGGAKQYVKQSLPGANFSVGLIATADVPSAALTKTDDTNVTLTLSGVPANALLQAAGIAVGWTGTLAAGRLNGNVVQAVTNDTNITGSVGTQTLTLGWTGTLSVARGGTGQGSKPPALLGAALTTGRIPKADASGNLVDGPTPAANATYTIDGAVAGTLSSITLTNGLITAITTR